MSDSTRPPSKPPTGSPPGGPPPPSPPPKSADDLLDLADVVGVTTPARQSPQIVPGGPVNPPQKSGGGQPVASAIAAGGQEGRAGVWGGPGAASFTLPPTPAVPSFDNGLRFSLADVLPGVLLLALMAAAPARLVIDFALT